MKAHPVVLRSQETQKHQVHVRKMKPLKLMYEIVAHQRNPQGAS